MFSGDGWLAEVLAPPFIVSYFLSRITGEERYREHEDRGHSNDV